MNTTHTTLTGIIHCGCKAAFIKTIAIFTLLLFALPASVQATVEVSTLAGSPGVSGSADGTGSAARFNALGGVAVDGIGNVYVADSGNHTIRKVTPGGVVSTLAGTVLVFGSADGIGGASQFDSPVGVAVDSAGNVYVADTNNHTIRKVTPGGVVTTLAGTPGVSGSDDGVGGAAQFDSPRGVAVDSDGNVYVADFNNHTIRKVTPGGVVTTLAGTALIQGSADGTGSAARFSFPIGVAVDGIGNVYVTDYANHTIRKVTPDGVVTTLAGSVENQGSADGAGSAARFASPFGVAVDGIGNVYVADSFNSTLRKVSPGGEVSTLAGIAGFVGSADGAGNAARFFQPEGVAVDSIGNVYMADTLNSTIRKVRPAPTISAVAKKSDTAVGIPNAKFASFGNPAMNGEGRMAFRATVTGTDALATKALAGKNIGIWADDSAGVRQLIVREGDDAGTQTGAIFSAFSEPVYNSNVEIAFKGTLKLDVAGGVVNTPAASANHIGVWSNTGGWLHPVARGADQAPGCPVGATFSTFTSLVLPDQGGVVMLAKLNKGAGGVDGTNSNGIWAVDTNGELRLIVRTGAMLDGQVITALSFLPAPAGVNGQSRNFSQSTGDLSFLATFAGGISGIYRVVFP